MPPDGRRQIKRPTRKKMQAEFDKLQKANAGYAKANNALAGSLAVAVCGLSLEGAASREKVAERLRMNWGIPAGLPQIGSSVHAALRDILGEDPS